MGYDPNELGQNEAVGCFLGILFLVWVVMIIGGLQPLNIQNSILLGILLLFVVGSFFDGGKRDNGWR